MDVGREAPLQYMRERLKSVYRSRLPEMGWCDDNARRKQQVEAAYSNVRGEWEAEALTHQPVLAAALEASTTDNEHQTIVMTVSNDRSFWSSGGHDSQVAHEALLYELSGPACRVVALQLAPYRALYQEGYPVYPPMRLQVWVGPSPCSLQPASPWHDVQASDALQTFALWPHAPLGRFLQVRMYGKLQKQREDLRFYVAIRHVSALGTPLTPPELLALQPLLRSNTLQLAGPTPGIPASATTALEAAADYGLGPEQVVDAAATYDSFSFPQQQQQQVQRGAVSELVVRALGSLQCLGTADRAWSAQQQQQHQQQQQQGSALHRVAAGLQSILGRRGAAAPPAVLGHPSEAGSSSSSSSKRHRQQQQWRQQQQNLPLWLVEEQQVALPGQQQQESSEADGQQRVELGGGGSSNPQAEGALAEHWRQLGGRGPAAAAGLDSDSEGSEGYSEEEEEEDEGGLWGPGSRAGRQGHAEAAVGGGGAAGVNPLPIISDEVLQRGLMERLRQVPPWQQEQVLAGLLDDQPIGGLGRAAGETPTDASELHTDATMTGAAAPPHTPPVVAVLPSNNRRSSGSSSSDWAVVPNSQDSGWAVEVQVALDQGVATGWLCADHLLVGMIPGIDSAEQQLLQARYAAAYNRVAEAGAPTSAAGASNGAAALMASGASPPGTQLARGAEGQRDGAAGGPVVQPALAASQLFHWQVPAADGISGSSSAAGSYQHASSCSSDSSTLQWLQPASTFCEGMEADLQACF